MWLLVVLCVVGACFGARAFFKFVGLLVLLPVAAACLLLGLLAFMS